MPEDWFSTNAPKSGDWFAQNAKSAPTPKVTGTLSARHGGAIGNWLEDAESDVRTGGDRTLVGKMLRGLGAQGTESGVSPGAAAIVGGPAVGPFKAAHGVTQLASHPVRGINEIVEGVGQMAAPFLAASQPEFIPGLVMAGVAQQGIEKGATAAGASPETAELVGNVGTLLLPGVAKKGVELAKKTPEGVRIATQKLTGVGPEITRDAVHDATEKFNKEKGEAEEFNEKSQQEAGQKADAAVAKAEEEHSAALLKAKQEYAQDVRDAKQKFGDNKEKVQQANSRAIREYNRKVGEAVAKNKAARETAETAAESQGRMQMLGNQMIRGLEKLNESTRQQANEKYATVREKVGGDSVPATDVADIVRGAQDKWIKGSPEKIKQFQAILSREEGNADTNLADQTARGLGYKNSADAMERTKGDFARWLPEDVQQGMKSGGEPLKFNDLQGFSEELGRRRGSGNLDSDVYNAIGEVREGIQQQMRKLAKDHGALEEYDQARDFYREYKRTFYEAEGPNGSGSPVARALQAKDPLKAARVFLGDGGDRGIALLRQYSPELANLAQEMQRVKRLTPTKVAEPKRAVSPQRPALTPEPAGENLPLPPVLPPRPDTAALTGDIFSKAKHKEMPQKPEIDTAQLKRDKLKETSRRITRFDKYDAALLAGSPIAFFTGHHLAAFSEIAALVGRKGFGAALDSPKVVEWLAKPRKEDIEALKKLPDESQADVAKQMLDFVMAQRKTEHVPLADSVKQWLQKWAVPAGATASVGHALRYGATL